MRIINSISSELREKQCQHDTFRRNTRAPEASTPESDAPMRFMPCTPLLCRKPAPRPPKKAEEQTWRRAESLSPPRNAAEVSWRVKDLDSSAPETYGRRSEQSASSERAQRKQLNFVLNSVIDSNVEESAIRIGKVLMEDSELCDHLVEQLVTNALSQVLYGKPYAAMLMSDALSPTEMGCISPSLQQRVTQMCASRVAQIAESKEINKHSCKGLGTFHAHLRRVGLLPESSLTAFLDTATSVLCDESVASATRETCCDLIISAVLLMPLKSGTVVRQFVCDKLQPMWQGSTKIPPRSRIRLLDVKDFYEASL